MPALNSLCPHCRQPLPALARLRGLSHCESAACRTKASQHALDERWHRAEEAAQKLDERWQAVGEAAVDRLAATLPPDAARPTLLWLQSVRRRLEPLTESHRHFLVARWRDAWQNDLSVGHDGQDTDVELPLAANALCQHCAGGCCVNGGSQAAFIDAAALRRWLGEHPGTTVDDAIADYLAHLPAEHIEDQCRYQAADGCTLPRAMRSDICNRYRCVSLDRLGAELQGAPDTLALVITRDGDRLEAAVVFQNGQSRALEGLSGPDAQVP